MGILEKIYDYSPVVFQNIMCTIAGIVNYRLRYGKSYCDELRFCEEFDKLTPKEQEEFQLKQVIEFIKYSNNNSRFYRELYFGIDLSKIKTIEDMKILPIVDKEMLRKNIDLVYTVPKNKSIIGNTGGTTGKSLTVRYTNEDYQIRMAVLDHFKARHGFVNIKMKRATFNGKHIIPPKYKGHEFWRFNAFCNQMIYSSFDLTEENMKYYVDSLNKFKPHAIDGFFSSICDIASYIERNNIRIDFHPIAVFPTSETLTDYGRQLIERVFSCKVYNQYASSEGAPFITECDNQRLHIEMNTGVFEILNTGELLVTSFTTHGTPLIRYAIGDSVELYNNEVTCKCGLNGQLVKRIEGRKLDYLLKTNGAKINAGNISNILKYMPNSVVKTQFHQISKNNIQVLLEIDSKRFKEIDRRLILDECIHTFGEDMNIDINVVESISREKSGKYRMIINDII